MASPARSFGASVVGWVILAFVVYIFFGGILSTIRFIIRMIVFLVVIGMLLSLYFRLKGD